jgi:hypothetical protein
MSKSLLMVVIALAAIILSLSLFANVTTVKADESPDSKKDEGVGPHHIKPIPGAKTHEGLCGGGHGKCATRVDNDNNNNNNHHSRNHHDNSKTTTTATTTTTKNNVITKTIVIPGYNATFFDINTPYCWYVVNAPPCYDLKTGTVIH